VEFIQRNVQTVEEKKTGYAVKIPVSNIAGKLKTGIPSDLNFELLKN